MISSLFLKYSRTWKRAAAIAALSCFVFDTLLRAAPALTSASPSVSASIPFRLELPPDLGTLEDFSAPSTPAAPFVIHIQDAHANPEAQEKIRDILKFLRRAPSAACREKSGASCPASGAKILVGLEGAFAELDPSRLELFGRKELNQSL